jgi:cytidyltransferase-like protein
MQNEFSGDFEKLLNPAKYQVFVFSCPACVPFNFARHLWFVVNQRGLVSRFEVLHTQVTEKEHWGYLHKDALPLFSGILKFPIFSKETWDDVKIIDAIEGDEHSTAREISDVIVHSFEKYPLKDKYSLFFPNSNSYVAWVLSQFPEWNIKLPWNAIGAHTTIAKKIGTGIVHGRFQPPHNGHLRYILSALEKTNHLYIGICTPEMCTPEVASTTGYPCTPELNPFSFDERAQMITAMLDAEGVKRNSYAIIPFPSDYSNLKNILVPNTVFLMSVTGDGDNAKITHIKKMGFDTKTILSIEKDADRERSGKVRDSATAGANWKELVPPAISEYIVKNGLESKLAINTKKV